MILKVIFARHACLGSCAVPRLCRLYLLRHAFAGSVYCATLLQALSAAPRFCRLFLLRHAFAGSPCCATLLQALPAASPATMDVLPF